MEPEKIGEAAREAARLAAAGAPPAHVAAGLARVPALIVRLKQVRQPCLVAPRMRVAAQGPISVDCAHAIAPAAQVEREFSMRARSAEAHMLEAKRRFDEAASPAQELLAIRAHLSHELSVCEVASRAPALDDNELVAAPSLEPGGPPPDEKQLRLRRRAAELRTRRELHAQIGTLRAAVSAARQRRLRLQEADESAKPELAKLLGAASSLDAYLSVPAPFGTAEPSDPQAHLLPPPLWALHAQATLLLGTPALGSTLYAVAIVPSAPGTQGAGEEASAKRPAKAIKVEAGASPLQPQAQPQAQRASARSVIKPSPLSVRLDILCARRKLALVFSYHPRLHVLTVSAPEGGAELLSAVDGSDDGLTFPHCRSLLAASRGERARAPPRPASPSPLGSSLPATGALTRLAEGWSARARLYRACVANHPIGSRVPSRLHIPPCLLHAHCKLVAPARTAQARLPLGSTAFCLRCPTDGYSASAGSRPTWHPVGRGAAAVRSSFRSQRCSRRSQRRADHTRCST